MDENLKDYLEVRFCSIDKRLTIMQSAIDELGTKIDIHGDRILSSEKDVDHLAGFIRDDKIETKERREDCLRIMDKKDETAIGKIKYWTAMGLLGGVFSVLGFVATLLVRMTLK